MDDYSFSMFSDRLFEIIQALDRLTAAVERLAPRQGGYSGGWPPEEPPAPRTCGECFIFLELPIRMVGRKCGDRIVQADSTQCDGFKPKEG